MTRKAVGIAALILALVLVAAGGLTLVGSRYISSNVHDQLAIQDISFAPAGSPGLPADIQSYGGTAVTNGGQAKVFADQYIQVHVNESIAEAAKTDPRLTGLTTYSQLSSLARTDPKGKDLTGLVDSVFKGQMLRSSLLSAWGWGVMASIMFWVAISAFGAAIVSALAGASLVPALASRLHLSWLTHHKSRPAIG
jgi:hypothetical protein